MEFERSSNAPYSKAISDDMVYVGLVSKEEKRGAKQSLICKRFRHRNHIIFVMALFLFSCFALVFMISDPVTVRDERSAKTLQKSAPLIVQDERSTKTLQNRKVTKMSSVHLVDKICLSCKDYFEQSKSSLVFGDRSGQKVTKYIMRKEKVTHPEF